jgi:hypothetical protein
MLIAARASRRHRAAPPIMSQGLIPGRIPPIAAVGPAWPGYQTRY